MLFNTKKKPWLWFAGLYCAGVFSYGAVELALHYLNKWLVSFT